jgi:transcription initiation factor IIE alpha subunit
MTAQDAITAELELGQATEQSLADNTGHALAAIRRALAYMKKADLVTAHEVPRRKGGTMTVWRLAPFIYQITR